MSVGFKGTAEEGENQEETAYYPVFSKTQTPSIVLPNPFWD